MLLVFILSACSSIKLDVANLELKVGDIVQITPETKDIPITYKSNNNSIVTVNEEGVVTAIGVGSTSVIATNSKGKTAECVVNVSHVQPTQIEFFEKELVLAPSQSVSLETLFIPENTSDRSLFYSVAQENIASVDEIGTVTGISAGTTSITAKSNNGVVATCTITVLPFAESISVDPTLKLVQGENNTLNIIFEPENCAKEELIWTSSDESIAKVVDGKVTAISTGRAIITVETIQTHLKTSCSITVTPPPLTISGLSMSRGASIVGSMYQISYDISASAMGGSGNGYSYKFEILQNGKVTKNTGWTKNNRIYGSISGNGTCELRVSVKDSAGTIAKETYDMIQ